MFYNVWHNIDLLGANEIHTFAIYGTRPRTAILDVNFVQQVLEKTIVWSFIHLTIDTIRHGYETLTGSNAKYSRHRVTMLVSPMDAKLIRLFCSITRE